MFSVNGGPFGDSGSAHYDPVAGALKCSTPRLSTTGAVRVGLTFDGVAVYFNPVADQTARTITFVSDDDPRLRQPSLASVDTLCAQCARWMTKFCVTDCFGTYRGDAGLDSCGQCSGGVTKRPPDIDKDCQGTCFGRAQSFPQNSSCGCFDPTWCTPAELYVKTSRPLDAVVIYQAVLAAAIVIAIALLALRHCTLRLKQRCRLPCTPSCTMPACACSCSCLCPWKQRHRRSRSQALAAAISMGDSPGPAAPVRPADRLLHQDRAQHVNPAGDADGDVDGDGDGDDVGPKHALAGAGASGAEMMPLRRAGSSTAAADDEYRITALPVKREQRGSDDGVDNDPYGERADTGALLYSQIASSPAMTGAAVSSSSYDHATSSLELGLARVLYADDPQPASTAASFSREVHTDRRITARLSVLHAHSNAALPSEGARDDGTRILDDHAAASDCSAGAAVLAPAHSQLLYNAADNGARDNDNDSSGTVEVYGPWLGAGAASPALSSAAAVTAPVDDDHVLPALLDGAGAGHTGPLATADDGTVEPQSQLNQALPDSTVVESGVVSVHDPNTAATVAAGAGAGADDQESDLTRSSAAPAADEPSLAQDSYR